MSLSVGSWLGVPSLPVVVSSSRHNILVNCACTNNIVIPIRFLGSQLLHRQLQNVALSLFESDSMVSRRLSSLSVWTTLQALGREAISERVLMALESCRIVHEILAKCDGIRLVVSVLR